jgi:hypothetical protein
LTPQQIEDAARRKYNSVGSSFYSSAEIWDLIYQAELEIARETKMLEGRTVVSGGTVAGTQSYAYPTGVLEIKRIEVDGVKLKKIDMREDDRITLLNANSTEQGEPLYYFDWGSTIYFRPIPDTSSVEIKIYYYKEPARVTDAAQVLEIPALFHMSIVDRVVAEMALKDGNQAMADRYFAIWYDRHLPSAMKWTRKRKTGDGFSVVRDEDDVVGTVLGPL